MLEYCIDIFGVRRVSEGLTIVFNILLTLAGGAELKLKESGSL